MKTGLEKLEEEWHELKRHAHNIGVMSYIIRCTRELRDLPYTSMGYVQSDYKGYIIQDDLRRSYYFRFDTDGFKIDFTNGDEKYSLKTSDLDEIVRKVQEWARYPKV